MGNGADGLTADFRDAMRRLAATVSIITVTNGDERHGSTATAVTSLSMDPPSLLVCMNRDSRLHGYLTREDRFCVNVLHVENEDMSRLFASPLSSSERFAKGDWLADKVHGVYLANAQANLFCRKEQTVDYGSHTIFIGRVVAVINRDDIAPLLYRNGGYAACADIEP
jgi:flavin reductase (DIM6/NTAB) family NADH-FMN oxidoreductase RutF